MEPKAIFDLAERNAEIAHTYLRRHTYGTRITWGELGEDNLRHYRIIKRDYETFCLVGAVIFGYEGKSAKQHPLDADYPSVGKIFEEITGQCHDCTVATFDEDPFEPIQPLRASCREEHAEWRQAIREWKVARGQQ